MRSLQIINQEIKMFKEQMNSVCSSEEKKRIKNELIKLLKEKKLDTTSSQKNSVGSQNEIENSLFQGSLKDFEEYFEVKSLEKNKFNLDFMSKPIQSKISEEELIKELEELGREMNL
jgi:hypothetical protein